MKPERPHVLPADDPIAYRRSWEEYEFALDQLFRPMFETGAPTEWIVEGLLPVGYLAVLAGPPKSGKTSMATALALAVAAGARFAGMSTRQSAVLWLAAEESVQERNLVLRESPLADPDVPLFTCYDRLNIDDPHDLDLIAAWVRRVDAKLLVVDPLLGAISGRSLADSWAARRTLRALKEFCIVQAVSAVVLHHRKQGGPSHTGVRVADNDQIAATASMNMVLREARRRAQERIVHLTCTGRGAWTNRNFAWISSGPLDYRPAEAEPVRTESESTQPDPLGAEDRIVALLRRDGPMSAAELVRESCWPEGTIRNALTRMRRRGAVASQPAVGRNRRYRLPGAEDAPRAEPPEICAGIEE